MFPLFQWRSCSWGSLPCRCTCTDVFARVRHTGDEWTETIITAVLSKTSNFTINGSAHQEISPIDKSTIIMTPTYEEHWTSVRTHHAFADGKTTQVLSRYLSEGGATYEVRNQIFVDKVLQVEARSYFKRC